MVSPRGIGVAQAMADRALAVLRPSPPAPGPGRPARIGYESFWHTAEGRVCVIGQYAETEYAAQDSVWLFPAERVVLYRGSHAKRFTVQFFLWELFLGILRDPAMVAAHLRRRGPPAGMALVEMLAPHVGHAVWNASSAWPRLFAVPGLPRPDCYVTWQDNVFLPPVTDLYPEEAARPLHRLQRPADLVGLIAAHGLLALVARDDWVTETLAQRVRDHAWASLAPPARAALQALRAGSRPLILFGLRLGNRAWLEQEEGLVALAAALRERFRRRASCWKA